MSKLRSRPGLFRAFQSNEEAQTAISFALALTPLMAFAGAAIDFGVLSQARSAAQNAVDTAVIDAAKTASTYSSSNINTAAINTQSQNMFNAAYRGPAISSLNVQTTVNTNNALVTTTATGKITPYLLPIVGINSVDIAVSAQSIATTTASPACLIALKPTGIGINATGNGKLQVDDCGIYINSSDPTQALYGQQNAIVKATAISIVGGYTTSIAPQPIPKTNQVPVADPLAGIPQPGPGVRPAQRACTYTSKQFTGTQTIPADTVYCNNIRFAGDITLSPGIHYFWANISVAAGTRLKGDNVTLFLGEGASLDSTGNGIVQLSAPDSGTYKGITIFGARSTNVWPTIMLSSNRDYIMKGTIYAPSHILTMSGDADANVQTTSGYLVAYSLSFSGSSSLTMTSTGITNPDLLKQSLINAVNQLRLMK